MDCCSRCEFGTRIEEANRAGIRYGYEDSPCSTCGQRLGSSRVMEFDETQGTPENEGRGLRPEDGQERREEVGGQRTEVGGQADEPVLPVSVLTEALRGFMDLPPRTFRILQRRYHGDSYRMIGEELQVTPQAAELQLRRALEAHPHLKNLLPEKARRQAARKRKRLSMARRGKPGAGK